MNSLYILIILACLGTGYAFFFKKFSNKEGLIKKVLACLLFFLYGFTLFNHDAIDATVSLEGVFSSAGTVLMYLLRWFTSVVIACAVFEPFFNNKILKKGLTYVAPLISILNILFINKNLVAIYGKNYYLNYDSFSLYIYLSLIVLLSFISFIYLYNKILSKDFKESKKDIFALGITLLVMLFAFFPEGLLMALFGEFGDVTIAFVGVHRISLYLGVASLVLLFFFSRKRTPEQKKLLLVILSFAALTQYFYLYKEGLNGLPLHLCNLSVILMFIAFVFNVRIIFNFTLLANVLAAFIAMMFPNLSADFFAIESVNFWLTHIYAFILPVLGLSLKVFPKPTYKDLKLSIFIFTGYFIGIVILNAWLNNKESVDYFYVYGDFLIGKFNFLAEIKYNFVKEVAVGEMVFKFFYLYQIIVYIVFVMGMFVTYLVYDYLYYVSDLHYKLALKEKQNKMDVLNLMKELDGRPLGDPIDLKGVNMIKIENFTKVYGNNKYKSVDDFSLVVNDGEVFGFLGHNGAGKSTTIKCMVGIQNISSGKIIVDGYDVSKQPLEAKLRMGYVSDNHAVYEKLTGREYINYVADLYLVSKEDREERIEKYLKMFKLQDFIDHEIRSYSHGMKQKIVVIASLIHNPKVWILDEPLTGLDPASAYEIKECMREHANNGNIVFFSSHVIEVVEKICDRICIISKGKLQGIYSLKELKEQGISLEQLYMQHVASENKGA